MAVERAQSRRGLGHCRPSPVGRGRSLLLGGAKFGAGGPRQAEAATGVTCLPSPARLPGAALP